MTKPRLLIWPALALALVCSLPARADVLPWELDLVAPAAAPKAGEVFTGELRLLGRDDATVGPIALDGAGWQLLAVDQSVLALAAGRPAAVAFTARCLDPAKPLVVTCEWNGRVVRRSFDLSPRVWRWAAGTAAVRRDVAPDDGRQPPGAPQAKPAPRPLAADPATGGDAGGNKSVSVRVRGRFMYVRPDGVNVGVDGMTVRIYDHDGVGDDHLLDTITDPDGRFDETFTFSDSWETYPDVYVKFEAANAVCEVKHPLTATIYRWETGTYDDVTSLNLGTLYSGDEDLEPALHLLTDTVRTWRFCHDEGYSPRYVQVEWPDGDEGAWYTGSSERIHISSEREWSDATLSHEFGHHFEECYDPTPSPGYCNGVCDDSATDCGHCIWCREDGEIAWSEGFANYFGYVVPDEYLARYGTACLDRKDVGDLETCSETGLYDPPATTEGYIAAALVDIHDTETGDNYPQYPGRADRLAMGPEEILDCVNDVNPTTPEGFLTAFIGRYPTLREQIWDTAANCGFDLDGENPDAPSVMYCASHAAGVASPDPTVEMTWITPDDDASGAHAYSYLFRAGAPGLPDTGADVVDANACTSAVLSPGTYWFCIRARDRAGNWSTGYGSWGPIVIREAEPSNLTEYARAGWDFPLVPSSVNTSTAGSTHVSLLLPDGTTGTYYNLSGQNDGESATSTGIAGRLYVDNVLKATLPLGTIAAHDDFYRNNAGPVAVAGGRHTLHYRFDALDAVAETDEGDNTTGHQFVWSPTVLTPGAVLSVPSQEHMLAGWENVHDGSALYYNCRGLRFANSGWWNAAVVWAHDNGDNYDVRLHNPSTSAQNGFGAALASSSRGFGCLDAVLVNRNTVSTTQFDVGVIFYGVYNDLGFDAQHVATLTAAFDTPVTRALGPDRWLELHEFNVSSANAGPVSAVVSTLPPTANVHVQWRGETFTTGRLSDCDAETVTGAEGTAILQFEVPDSGFNSLCLYRDPRDGDADVAVTFTIRRTPPDLAPLAAAGWHSPLVPRPAADGTPTSVALPDTLHGNMNLTYHNLALANLSPADADSVRAYIWLDGQSHAGLLYPLFVGGGTSRFNYTFPYVVRGGRHTLSLNIDPYGRIAELDETNNVHGEQYVWSPLAVAQGATVTRVAPPAMDGGWAYITSGEPRYYDCDGLRLAAPTGWWAALAVMPGDTSNVDVRLHQPQPGAKNGFRTNLAYSSWGAGASDFVLVNFNLTARQPYDAGVLGVSGAQPYTAEHVRESYLGTHPAGAYGPYSLPAGGIVRLHEMLLAPGWYRLELANVAGNVDWGLTLHPRDQAWLRKSVTVRGGAAWLGGAGAGEQAVVEITEEGYYCLAVWKKGAADLPLAGQYRLTIVPFVSPVPDPSVLPARTALVGVWPNPFNPQTTIAFDLAADGPARLVVHDLSGKPVRVLVDAPQAAGRHEVVWDGRDDAGRRAASGTYVARLVAGGVTQTRKLVIVK